MKSVILRHRPCHVDLIKGTDWWCPCRLRFWPRGFGGRVFQHQFVNVRQISEFVAVTCAECHAGGKMLPPRKKSNTSKNSARTLSSSHLSCCWLTWFSSELTNENFHEIQNERNANMLLSLVLVKYKRLLFPVPLECKRATVPINRQSKPYGCMLHLDNLVSFKV